MALARKEENRRLAEEKKRGEVVSTSSSSSSQNEESSGLGLVALLLGGGLAAIRAIMLAVKYLFGKKENVSALPPSPERVKPHRDDIDSD